MYNEGHMRYLFTISVLILYIIPSANAETSKYFCTGEVNQFFIIINTKKKTIITGNSNPKKYWIKDNYTFWHSASEYSVYEYTFKKSYNRLSGILNVKSHHLVTSQEEWFDYRCSIT